MSIPANGDYRSKCGKTDLDGRHYHLDHTSVTGVMEVVELRFNNSLAGAFGGFLFFFNGGRCRQLPEHLEQSELAGRESDQSNPIRRRIPVDVFTEVVRLGISLLGKKA